MQLSLKEPSRKGNGTLRERGRFTFIDLAGSERASDTSDNDKQRRKEGAEVRCGDPCTVQSQRSHHERRSTSPSLR